MVSARSVAYSRPKQVDSNTQATVSRKASSLRYELLTSYEVAGGEHSAGARAVAAAAQAIVSAIETHSRHV